MEAWDNLDLAIKTTEPPNPILHNDCKQLQPHEQRAIPFDVLQFATIGPKYVSADLPTPQVAVVFTHINGRRWLRSPDWRLHDVTDNAKLAERIVSGWVQTPPTVEAAFKDIWHAHYGDR